MIRIREARLLAEQLHARYAPWRAVILIGRCIEKGLFRGRSDEVVYWALVFAHYRGGELSDQTEERLKAFRKDIIPDDDDEE